MGGTQAVGDALATTAGRVVGGDGHGGHDGYAPGPALLVPLVLFWVYLAAALRQRGPDGGGWPHRRTAAFGAGAG
ncbi:hypothetical protein AB0C00_12735, partial [Micromonospora carbonacea]